MTAQAASHVYFGLNPMWESTCILAITYATIMSEKVNSALRADFARFPQFTGSNTHHPMSRTRLVG